MLFLAAREKFVRWKIVFYSAYLYSIVKPLGFFGFLLCVYLQIFYYGGFLWKIQKILFRFR